MKYPRTAGIFLILTLLLPALAQGATVSTPTTKTYLPSTDNSNIIIKRTNYDPSPAEPGEYVDIFIAVQNLGNRDFQQTWLKLDEDYPFSLPPGDDGIELIELIPAGREELLEYRLFVDDQALEGIYDLDLVLCSDPLCENELRKTSFDINIKTGGVPKLEIGLEDSSVFIPGTLGEITLSAVNRGKLGIQFLVLEVMDSENYELISPSRVYIGELNSDDFETEDFQIYINDNAPSEVTVPVKVEYSDDNFKEYAGVENIKLRIFSKDEAKKIGIISDRNWVLYAVLSAIALILLFFFYRRRKKKHES